MVPVQNYTTCMVLGSYSKYLKSTASLSIIFATTTYEPTAKCGMVLASHFIQSHLNGIYGVNSRWVKKEKAYFYFCFCNAQSGIDFSPTLGKQISLKTIPVIGPTWQMNCFLYSLCDAFYSFPTDSYQFSFFRFVSIYNDRASPARWLLSLQTPSNRVN